MAYTDREDLNYLGQLYLIGETETPFLSMMGGMGRGLTTTSFRFPVSQPYSLSSASQNTQSEATAATEGTPTTVTRGQVYNVCQIMKYDVEVTIAKQSTTGEFSGIQVIGSQPVVSEFDFQKNAQLRQLALDIEYSFINGTFVDVSLATTNQTTRGIIEATSTNAVNASSADLSKSLIDQLLRTMKASGAPMRNAVIMVNAFQKQQISDIYGFAPTDRNIGGLNISQIETDFGRLGVVYNPQIPAATLQIVEMSVCDPVYCTARSIRTIPSGLIVFVDKAVIAAKEGGFWYTQIGLSYGHEKFHGKITNLSTS